MGKSTCFLTTCHAVSLLSFPSSFLFNLTKHNRETNLKVREALPRTKNDTTEQLLAKLNGQLTGEIPNTNLEKYAGVLKLGPEQLALENKNIVLRGCLIRNTKVVHGLVVFAGRDTKLMQNSGLARFKRTQIDLQMNTLILIIFGTLFLCCAIAAVMSSVWESTTGDNFTAYLFRDEFHNTNLIAFLQFFSYIIVLNTLVPISLYVR